ncbi:MAG: DUF2059 domain-containing protein [Desulfobacteraceae bacterium]|jgi:hypothetical protein
MRKKKHVLWAIPLLWLIVAATPVYSAKIYFKNGSSIECDKTWKTGDFVWIKKSRGVMGYPIGDVDLKATFGETLGKTAGKSRGETDKEALILELWELSGLQKQVAQLDDLSVAGLTEQYQAGRMPPQVYEYLVPILKDAYQADRIKRHLLARFKKSLDPACIEAVLSWLQSPLGRKITKLEQAASTPEGVRQMTMYAAMIQTDPPPQARLRLVERLDEALKVTDLMLDMATITVNETMNGVVAAMPQHLDMDPLAMSQLLKTHREEMRRQFQKAVTTTFLYAYQPLSDRELEQYIAFAESEHGMRYHKVLVEEMKRIQMDASYYVAKGMNRFLPSQM